MIERISCDLHDYFEIVCMRQSNIKITLFNDITYHGKAISLTTHNGVECIEIALINSDEVKSVNLTEIHCLSALGNRNQSHNFDVVL